MLCDTFARVVLMIGCVVVLSIDLSIAQEGSGATPVPAQDSPELTEMKADAALAKTKLELATAEMDLLKLKLGAIDTTNLPKGTAAATDMDLAGQLRAYAAAKKSTDAVAKEATVAYDRYHIGQLKTDQEKKEYENAVSADTAVRKIVLATDAQLQQLNQYRAFLAQMTQFKENANFVIANPPSLGDPSAVCVTRLGAESVAGVLAAINTALTVSALFKTEVDLKGKSVTLDEFAIATLMLRSLTDEKVSVVYPGSYYLLPPRDSDGVAFQSFKEVSDLKPKLGAAAKALSAQYATILAANPKPDPACQKILAAIGKTVDQYVAGIAAIEKSIDEVGATLTKQEAQSGLTILSSYLVSERVEAAIGSAPVLQVKAIAAGGATQTRRNLFKTTISYGGGSIISYRLFAQDGQLLAADTIPWNSGLRNANDFKAGRVSLDTD